MIIFQILKAFLLVKKAYKNEDYRQYWRWGVISDRSTYEKLVSDLPQNLQKNPPPFFDTSLREEANIKFQTIQVGWKLYYYSAINALFSRFDPEIIVNDTVSLSEVTINPENQYSTHLVSVHFKYPQFPSGLYVFLKQNYKQISKHLQASKMISKPVFLVLIDCPQHFQNFVMRVLFLFYGKKIEVVFNTTHIKENFQ